MKPRQLPSHPPFDPAEADIQRCAYFLWREEGCPAGRDLDIWLTAKELLRHRTHVPGEGALRTAPPRRRPTRAPWLGAP